MIQRVLSAALFALVAFATAPTFGANHLVCISEVYSNADGTIQYVELQADANGQTNFAPTQLVAEYANENGSTIRSVIFNFTAAVSWSDGDRMLIATEGYEDEYPDTPPDFVMDNNSVPLESGSIRFRIDNSGLSIDRVDYGDFGTNPAEVLPNDGCTSLTRNSSSSNSSLAFDIEDAEPENLDGDTEVLTCTFTENDFKRGDVNSDDVVVPIVDGIFMLTWKFLEGDPPECLDAADCDDDGYVHALLDTLYLLLWGYGGGDDLASPGPDECGGDGSNDNIGCELPTEDCDV